ncbi:MAG TPA: ribosome silencing factor [Flavobacteriales bacterium]|nr:ribosome silencing factor [Salibacteraceae bacterium]HAW20657.1 ribosome silencing factor [Flavobacteriales bacterium]
MVKGNSEKLTDIIVNGILEKKGLEIKVLDMRKIGNAITDFYIICHGTSDRQVDSISDSIEEIVRSQLEEKPISVEGRTQAEWILMDFTDVIVHIFQEDVRSHYALEDLWADAQVKTIEV